MDTPASQDPARRNVPATGPVAAQQLTLDDLDPAELQALTADVSARLRRVCGHLSDEEFSALVLDVARVRIRYDIRAFGRARSARRVELDD